MFRAPLNERATLVDPRERDELHHCLRMTRHYAVRAAREARTADNELARARIELVLAAIDDAKETA